MVRNLKLALLTATTLAMTPAFGADAEGGAPVAPSLTDVRAAIAVKKDDRNEAQTAAVNYAADESSKIVFGEGLDIPAVDQLLNNFPQMMVRRGLMTADEASAKGKEAKNVAMQSMRVVRTIADAHVSSVSAADHQRLVAEAEAKAAAEAKKDMVAVADANRAVDSAFKDGQAYQEASTRLTAALTAGYDKATSEHKALLDAVKAADAKNTLGIDALDTEDDAAVNTFLTTETGEDTAKATGLVHLIRFALDSKVEAVQTAVKNVQLPAPSTAGKVSDAQSDAFDLAVKAAEGRASSGDMESDAVLDLIQTLVDALRK